MKPLEASGPPWIDGSVPGQKNLDHEKIDAGISYACQGSVMKPRGVQEAVCCWLAGPGAPMAGVQMSTQGIHWKWSKFSNNLYVVIHILDKSSSPFHDHVPPAGVAIIAFILFLFSCF